MTRVPLLRGSLMALLAAGALWGCQSPEAFHITGDGSLLNVTEGTGGSDGTGGDLGTGGIIASTGGIVGSGGQAIGGKGGAPGSGGVAPGSGGATGGSTSTGGKGGAPTGTGGATGGTASGGKGGSTSSGGVGGSASTGGKGGAAGGAPGSGGTMATGPCAGLCDNPVIFPGPSFSSSNLGTSATCHQTMASLQGGNCSNFVSPRTFKVNDVAVSCNNNNWSPGPKRNGGYCLQASAGNQSYASFVTF